MAVGTINALAASDGCRNNNDSTWAGARDTTPANELATWCRSTTSGGLFYNGRLFMYFPLTSIPGGATITGGTLIIPAVGNKADNDSTVAVVDTHTADGAIVVGDYNLYGGNNHGSVDWTSLSTTGTTGITVNSTGLTNIENNIGGTANLCLRNSLDFNNSAPSGANDITFNPDNADLIVAYTPSGRFLDLTSKYW